MMWILMSLTAVAAYFYGRYYQAQASKWKDKAEETQRGWEQALAQERDTRVRYEGVIADLKSRLTQLEDNIYVSKNPDELRLLFSQLFPSNS